MKRLILYTVGLVFMVSMGGCDDFRNPDQIPAFLYIDHPEKIVTSDQGSSSNRITEAYVYINDEFLGAYAFGRSFPFLNTGPTKITIFSGIRMNNLDEQTNIYNIYARYEETIDLQPGETDTIRPEVRYSSAADFVLVDNFEGTSIFKEDLDGNPGTFMGASTDVVFEGNQSGVLTVDAENSVAEVGTEDVYTNLKRGSPVFMELDFKGETSLFIGIIGYDGVNQPQRFYKLQLFPRDNWTKVYVELTDEIFELRKEAYQFVLMAIYSSEVNKEVQRVYVDNVKIIQL